MRAVIDLNMENHRNSTRRAFLRRAATSSVFALSPRWLRSQSALHRPATLYVTDAMEKYAERPGLQWSAAAARVPGATIEIDSTLEYQPILGFGAALTEASCFLLHSMPAPARHVFLSETYSPLGLNLTLGRSCIGASDYSRSIYSYDDVPDDMNLDHFSLKHDEACVLPTLREIRQINPQLFLMATPWSPPGWMKTYGLTFGGRTTENLIGPYTHSLWDMANESMLGGWMSDQHLGVYSRYITKFLQGYAQAGAPVQAISCQNEVETTQNGRMPACRWSPGLEAAFVRDHLGPSLRAQHLETQIWLLDHNYNYYQRVAAQLEDQNLARYVDGVAFHGYTGTPDQMSLLHRKKPEHPLPLDRRRTLYRRSQSLPRLGQVGRHLHRRAGELVPLRHYLEPDARFQRQAERRALLLRWPGHSQRRRQHIAEWPVLRPASLLQAHAAGRRAHRQWK